MVPAGVPTRSGRDHGDRGASHDPGRSPRLNPFAFPSDTDFRLGLLVVFIVISSLAGPLSVPGTFRGGEREEIVACIGEARGETDLLEWLRSADAIQALWARFLPCVDDYLPVLAVAALAGPVLAIGLAFVLHLLTPSWIRWRRRLVPLEPDAPDLAAELEERCREIGLSKPPRFVWNPLQTGGAFAFGRPGRCWVALFGDVVRRRVSDPDGFRAIVLHELAHVRNGDVNKTYLAMSLWRAYLLVGVLPYFATLPWALEIDRTPGNLLAVTSRLLAATLLVYLTRNAVLRARELYADVRASTDPATAGKLRLLFERGGQPRRFLPTLGPHPSAARRLAVLDRTDQLFRFGGWEAFAAGLAAGMAMPVIVVICFLLLAIAGAIPSTTLAAGWLVLIVGVVIPALLTTAPAVGALWTGVWRASFALLLRGRAAIGAARLGLAFASGLLLGPGLSFAFGRGFFADMAHLAAPTAVGMAFLLLWYVFVLAVLGAAIGLFLVWTQQSADAWFEPSLRAASPGRYLSVGLILAVVGFGLAFGLVLFVHIPLVLVMPSAASYQQIGEMLPVVAVALLGALVLNPWNLVLLLVLWAFPLAARLAGADGRSAMVPQWAYLDRAAPRATPPRPPLRPARALLVGLIVALLFVLAQLLGMRPLVSRLAGLDLSGGALVAALVAVTAAFQVPAAIVTAASVKRLRVIHALLAAFVTGTISGLAVTLVPPLMGWAEGVGDPLFMLALVVYAGALLALPFAWIAAGLSGPIARFRWFSRPIVRGSSG